MKYSDLEDLENRFQCTFNCSLWSYYSRVGGFEISKFEFDMLHRDAVRQLIREIDDNRELATACLDRIDNNLSMKEQIQAKYGDRGVGIIEECINLPGTVEGLISSIGCNVISPKAIKRPVRSRSCCGIPIVEKTSKAVVAGTFAWESDTKLIVHIPSGLTIGSKEYKRADAITFMTEANLISGVDEVQPSSESLRALAQLVIG